MESLSNEQRAYPRNHALDAITGATRGATMTFNLLTWLGGSWASIDLTPGDYPELHDEAACDKHRELVSDAAIEALQQRIVERGGTVKKDGAQ